MQKKHTEIVKIHGGLQLVPSHQQLMKVNRLLLGVVAFLMLVVVILGVFFIPNPDPLSSYNKTEAVKAVSEGMNPVVSVEINSLKGQMIGLVSGSIESKLKTLETSLKSGALDNSLGTIEDLKNDIKVLRTYSVEPKKELQVSNQDLAQEVSYLKKLIYMTLGSCGLMFIAAAGVWVKYKRLPHSEIKSGFLGRR